VRSIVYGKLTSAGLQPHQALGALWSLGGESGTGLNPGAYNPKDPGGAVGIGQWNGPRRAALEAFAQARGTAVTDPNTQADFLVDELTNPKAATYQPGVFTKMQGAQNAADATKIWTTQFERPAKDNSAARIAQGQNVGTVDDQGNLALGKGSFGTGAAPTTAVASGTTPATTPAATTPFEDNRTIWQKLTGPQLDAQGNPVQGSQSPMQQLASASESRLSKEGQTERDEEPIKSALSQGGPGARNVSPGLANPQVYGQTLNSFSQPLTWSSKPLTGAGMPAAGLQPAAAAPVPGLSLTSFQPPSPGLGYGINPVGYGFG
jgi:hypothetical protein